MKNLSAKAVFLSHACLGGDLVSLQAIAGCKTKAPFVGLLFFRGSGIPI